MGRPLHITGLGTCKHIHEATSTLVYKLQLIAFGFSFSICWGTSVGLGRHEGAVKPEWRSPLKKSEYAFSVLYVSLTYLSWLCATTHACVDWSRTLL